MQIQYQIRERVAPLQPGPWHLAEEAYSLAVSGLRRPARAALHPDSRTSPQASGPITAMPQADLVSSTVAEQRPTILGDLRAAHAQACRNTCATFPCRSRSSEPARKKELDRKSHLRQASTFSVDGQWELSRTVKDTLSITRAEATLLQPMSRDL